MKRTQMRLYNIGVLLYNICACQQVSCGQCRVESTQCVGSGLSKEGYATMFSTPVPNLRLNQIPPLIVTADLPRSLRVPVCRLSSFV